MLVAIGGFVWRYTAGAAAPAVSLPVTGAELRWDAGQGPNQPDRTTVLDAREATILANRINETPERAPGVYNCPADQGIQVTARFESSDAAAQVVQISLTGCGGPAGRQMSDALAAELRKLAPAGYYPTGW